MISPTELATACAALGITTEETINEGEVATDAILIIRARRLDAMESSCLLPLISDDTDYITTLGMLRWAQLIEEQRKPED